MERLLKIADPCLVLRLKEYSVETGTRLENNINAALEEWLECIAEPNLKAFRAKSKLMLVK